jgi:hypothetical protein
MEEEEELVMQCESADFKMQNTAWLSYSFFFGAASDHGAKLRQFLHKVNV